MRIRAVQLLFLVTPWNPNLIRRRGPYQIWREAVLQGIVTEQAKITIFTML
jgi:hypothetical protein